MRIRIIMTTYVPDAPKDYRLDMAMQCMKAWSIHLAKIKGVEFVFHIADDGSKPEIYRDMQTFSARYFDEVHFSHVQRLGIGGSLNYALSLGDKLTDDLWIYTTDDWCLTDRLDLRQAIDLIGKENYDVVRLGPIHPDLICITRFRADITDGWWLHIRHQEGGYGFGTRPFIATPEFFKKIGPFKERCNAYEVENDYLLRVKNKAIRIAQIGNIGLAGPWMNLDSDSTYQVGHIDDPSWAAAI